MNVYDLIYVQLQLILFRNEPVSQYSERELSCNQTLCWIQNKTTFNTDFETRYPFKLIDQDIGTLSWCKGLSNYIICNSILHWSQITIICKKCVGIRLSEDHEASSAWLSGGYGWRVNCTLFSIWNNLAQHIRYLVWPNRSSTNTTDYVTKYRQPTDSQPKTSPC